MHDDKRSTQSSVPRMDADAVCERCGTVNPEDTLICKQCGNNLRDQRLHRIAAEGGGELMGERIPPKRLLKGLLTILGLLSLIYVAVYRDAIVERLTKQNRITMDNPRSFWIGEGSTVYAQLAQQLAAQPVTKQDMEAAARAGSLSQEGVAGRYFITLGAGAREPMVGSAIVSQQDDKVFFVARLAQDLEIRGSATVMPGGRLIAEFAGVQTLRQHFAALGYATPVEPGTYTCYGKFVDSQDYYEAQAHRIP